MAKRDKICLVLAAACLAFGVLLMKVYTAIRFTGFLFCCGAAALVVYVLLDCWGRKNQTGIVCKHIFWAFLAAGFLFFAVLEIRVISCARTDTATPVAAVVVFGAGVNGRSPSLSLLSRLEATLEYIQDKPDIPIVVTGSKGSGEEISEARCMADWLTAHGVPENRVYLEEQADNTEENIAYSLALLSENGVDVTDNIAFCTSDYHLCRAMYLRGSPNTVPVAAHMPAEYWPVTLNYYVREAFGLAAAIVF